MDTLLISTIRDPEACKELALKYRDNYDKDNIEHIDSGKAEWKRIINLKVKDNSKTLCLAITAEIGHDNITKQSVAAWMRQSKGIPYYHYAAVRDVMVREGKRDELKGMIEAGYFNPYAKARGKSKAPEAPTYDRTVAGYGIMDELTLEVSDAYNLWIMDDKALRTALAEAIPKALRNAAEIDKVRAEIEAIEATLAEVVKSITYQQVKAGTKAFDKAIAEQVACGVKLAELNEQLEALR